MLAILTLIACLLLAGCARQAGGPPASRVTVISRNFLPPSGEPGIVPPRLLGDAHALWAPVTAREAALASAPLPDVLSRDWVSHSEEGAMRVYLHRLTRERRKMTARALRRAGEHMDMIRETLRRHGLPAVLACLPLVESAFENEAVSSAGAAGLWQLMPHTARRFGLVVSAEQDERFDPAKATEAAAAYLAFLYGRFGDWPLAVAAYNCGEGAMERALRHTGARTLADLSEAARTSAGETILYDETLRFAPRFAAAVAVMTDSAALGLTARPLLPKTSARIRPGSPSPRADYDHDTIIGDQERLPRLSGSYDEIREAPPAPARTPPSTRWLMRKN